MSTTGPAGCFLFVLVTAAAAAIVLMVLWQRRRRPAARLCPGCGVKLPPGSTQKICGDCAWILSQAHSQVSYRLKPPPLPDSVAGPEQGIQVLAGPGRADPMLGVATVAYAGPEPPREVTELAGRLPNLDIVEVLGQGGMGVVYKARQTKLDRLVALKVMRSETHRDEAFAERFLREARALARLSHPGIVAVHDFGEAGGVVYFLMEYVEGVNLRRLLGGRALPPDQALRLVAQVCEALQYAHEQGVVHRDIKPENILIDRMGRVKLADFGLAKLLGPDRIDGTLTATQQAMGSLNYVAPEQLESAARVDQRADIYSLGVVLYEMLTGQVPRGKFAPPSQKTAVSARVDSIVLRALESEPERRFQNVREMLSAVQGLVQPQGGVSAREMVPWPGAAAEERSRDKKARPPDLRSGLVLLPIGICVLGMLFTLMPWGRQLGGGGPSFHGLETPHGWVTAATFLALALVALAGAGSLDHATFAIILGASGLMVGFVVAHIMLGAAARDMGAGGAGLCALALLGVAASHLRRWLIQRRSGEELES